jgi:hypothetical protein
MEPEAIAFPGISAEISGYRSRVTDSQLLNQYLAVIDKECDSGRARLARGQFHDVVLLGEVAYPVSP